MASIIRGSGESSFSGSVSIGGTLTYEDVTSVDSVGVITARSGIDVGTGTSISSPSSNVLTLGTNNEERLRIDSDGKFGLGTTSPGRTLDVNGIIRADGTSGALAFGGNSSTPSEGVAIHRPANDTMALCTASTERMRIDSSGRLLVGTSSDLSGGTTSTGIQLATAGGGYLGLGKDDTSVGTNNGIGGLRFYANDPSTFNLVAELSCNADAAHSSNNYPTRLVFSTTANGASSPTERMRIDSSGRLLLNSGSDVRMELGTNGTTGTNDRNHVRGDGNNMKYNSCAGGSHIFESNGGERMQIDC